MAESDGKTRGDVRGLEYVMWRDSEGRDWCHFPGRPASEPAGGHPQSAPQDKDRAAWGEVRRKWQKHYGNRTD